MTRRLVATLLAGFFAGVAFVAIGRATGALIVNLSLGRPASEWLVSVVTVLAMVAALVFVPFFLHRQGATRTQWIAVHALALLFVTGGWMQWIASAPPTGAAGDLKSLTPMPAHAEVPEVNALRPAVTYRTNGFGMRGADWPKRSEGERRVAVLGDSFVFGMGVADDQTITEALARAAAAVGLRDTMFVNLGVPGGNLRTHVDVLEAALAIGLAPDLVLFHVTSNDFAGWNPKEAREAARGPGAYSLAVFLLGDDAGPWLRAALYGLGTNPTDEARMRVDELHRLSLLAARAGAPLLVFAYTPGDLAKLTPVLGAARVTAVDGLRPEWFIDRDGHPTPAGNAAFAAHLAPRVKALLDP